MSLENWEFNQKLSEYRIVVENVIKRIKDWRILSNVYRHSIDSEKSLNINIVFKACCILTQLDLKKNPIRSEYWIPKSFCEFF